MNVVLTHGGVKFGNGPPGRSKSIGSLGCFLQASALAARPPATPLPQAGFLPRIPGLGEGIEMTSAKGKPTSPTSSGASAHNPFAVIIIPCGRR